MRDISPKGGLARNVEADLIEDKNQEGQNNKDKPYPEIIGFAMEFGQPHSRKEKS